MAAQRVIGPWEDATIAPRGVLRYGISTAWTHGKERFRRGDSGVEPLGADFRRDSLGPVIIEALRSLEDPLRTLSGLGAPPLSLGALRVDLDATAYVTPISFEYGATSRVALSAVIPYIKNRVDVFAFPNPGGPSATLGINPALTVSAARSRNGQVVAEIQTAATRLQSELTRCLNNADPSCAALNANRQAAIDLVATAGAAANSVAAVYGTAAAAGAPFAPVDRSPLHTAIDARLASLNTQFVGFLGAPPGSGWVAARPVPAAPLAYDDFQRLVVDSAFGIVARPLTSVEYSHVGDIELGAKALLIDTYGQRVGAAPVRSQGVRLAVAGLVRLPTAQVKHPDDLAGLGTGDRQLDFELRGYLDAVANSRLWASAAVRYGVQRAAPQTMRITESPGDPFPALFRRHEIRRDPGDFLELELAPRFVPNDALAFSANYRLRQKAADSYAGVFDVVAPGGSAIHLDAATLGRDSEQVEHRLGFAVTYSTIHGYAERLARWPMEVSLVHTQALAGRGAVLKETSTAVVIRIYRRLVGPNPIRPDRR